MSGQTELELVKMKLSTTGRPSFISSGSKTLRPSSRQLLIPDLLVLHADDRRT